MWRDSACRTAKLNSKLSLSHLQLIKHKPTRGLNIWWQIRHIQQVYASQLVQYVLLHLFKHGGGDNAPWIPKNNMAEAVVQWDHVARISEKKNFTNLRISCYYGNNDRSARVLFVHYPREQGEWLRQNHRYARVLTASFALLPRLLDKQHPRIPVIILHK